jgi:Asp-tRNA(Asn)/Glu-tRNA(Gln) amidotransferase A subunit family amidase
MARTVADVAVTLDVVAGADPADSVTAASAGKIPPTYTAFLDANALRGARLGVVRRLSDRPGADPEVVASFDRAIEDLQRAGATVIDSIDVWVLDSVRVTLCSSFRRDFEAHLASLGAKAPFRTLQELADSGGFHVTVESRLRRNLDDGNAGDPERCAAAAESVGRFREGLRAVLAHDRLDALIYPTWSNPPRLIGDLSSPAGDNSQNLAPPSGFPAISVPMGWVHGGVLPTGLSILGDMWSESKLIALAYAYEQATNHRRPPPTTPPLR